MASAQANAVQRGRPKRKEPEPVLAGAETNAAKKPETEPRGCDEAGWWHWSAPCLWMKGTKTEGKSVCIYSTESRPSWVRWHAGVAGGHPYGKIVSLADRCIFKRQNKCKALTSVQAAKEMDCVWAWDTTDDVMCEFVPTVCSLCARDYHYAFPDKHGRMRGPNAPPGGPI